MTPPPTNIDGTDITGATIDGQAVEEITVDGDTVFTAGPDIPNSAVEQWPAADYDASADEWVGQVGGVRLTGGSATKTTDANGNTVVRYGGSDGQEHETTAISLSYDRTVLGVVFRTNNTTSDQILVSDTSDPAVYFRTLNGSQYGVIFGDSEQNGGTVDTDLHLAFVYGPRFGSSTTDELEIDGNTVINSNSGIRSYTNGIYLGNYSGSGFAVDADVLEFVVYQNPTQSQINGERTRLTSKYSGL